MNNEEADQLVMICSDCHGADWYELTLVDGCKGLFTGEAAYAENTCPVGLLDLLPENLSSKFSDQVRYKPGGLTNGAR